MRILTVPSSLYNFFLPYSASSAQIYISPPFFLISHANLMFPLSCAKSCTLGWGNMQPNRMMVKVNSRQNLTIDGNFIRLTYYLPYSARLRQV